MNGICLVEKKVQPVDDPRLLPLNGAPQAYETLCNMEDGCIKVVLDPAA